VLARLDMAGTVQVQCQMSLMVESSRRRVTRLVLGAPIDEVTWNDSVARISAWAGRRESRCVNFCNVHSVVTALGAWRYFDAIESGDLNLPDGAPIAWVMRSAGATGQPRISGPDLMWRYLAVAEREGHVVSFYGDTEDTLHRLRAEMLRAFPGLRIGVLLSPPFGPISAAQDADDVCRINDAGSQVLFVALGCPKQELWMDAHRRRVQATMLGVGAAVATHAGVIRRAPVWMQHCGLEWLHRLLSEPRRLARRYLFTNSAFVLRILFPGRGAR